MTEIESRRIPDFPHRLTRYRLSRAAELERTAQEKAAAEQSSPSKLSEENIREIREWYSDGTFTKAELALIFDVNVGAITNIVLNRGIWRGIA